MIIELYDLHTTLLSMQSISITIALLKCPGSTKYPTSKQSWGKYIDSVLGYKYKYIKNVQVQVQVQGFAKCTWVLTTLKMYLGTIIKYKMYNITHKNIQGNA